MFAPFAWPMGGVQPVKPARPHHKAATAADLLPHLEEHGPLQCWATPADRRLFPADAKWAPCDQPGTGRLGMCPEHAAEFIDPPAVDVDETAA